MKLAAYRDPKTPREDAVLLDLVFGLNTALISALALGVSMKLLS